MHLLGVLERKVLTRATLWMPGITVGGHPVSQMGNREAWRMFAGHQPGVWRGFRHYLTP